MAQFFEYVHVSFSFIIHIRLFFPPGDFDEEEQLHDNGDVDNELNPAAAGGGGLSRTGSTTSLKGGGGGGGKPGRRGSAWSLVTAKFNKGEEAWCYFTNVY